MSNFSKWKFELPYLTVRGGQSTEKLDLSEGNDSMSKSQLKVQVSFLKDQVKVV